VRAQEAVTAGDVVALKRELTVIVDTLEHITFSSFGKVDPNPYSPNYVNPVVWGKTVAPLATPFQADDPPPGPSGTAIPAFQLLDIALGRSGHATSIGRETARVRPWFPKHWRDFLDAAEAVSIPQYVARTTDRALRGIFREALEAYAGRSGLLGRHKLKTFGFLDLSFKAGRSKTLGGFGGGFDDRLWDRMDTELDLARLERYQTSPRGCH
jgi:sulfite reductase (NADPH) flavoprotein alpha-component